jgi:hypothetical protein
VGFVELYNTENNSLLKIIMGDLTKIMMQNLVARA